MVKNGIQWFLKIMNGHFYLSNMAAIIIFEPGAHLKLKEHDFNLICEKISVAAHICIEEYRQKALK